MSLVTKVWGGAGGLIVWLMAASVPVSAYVSRTADGAVQRRDIFGNLYWMAEGGHARAVSLLAALASSAIAAHTIFQRLRRGERRPLTFASRAMIGLGLWASICSLYRHEGSAALLESGLVVVLLLGVVAQPPTRRSVQTLAILLELTCLSVLLYRLAEPGLSATACRADGKCGMFGELLTAYFPQENFLAIFLVSLLPAVAFMRSTVRFLFTSTLTATVVAMTGSRAALVGVAVALAGAWWLRRKFSPPGGERGAQRFPVLLRLVPPGMLAVSAYTFFTLSGQSFTGRGNIYAAVRSQLSGLNIIFGPGMSALRFAANAGLTKGFQASHEHGQVPHLLGRYGLPGLMIFLVAVVALLRLRRVSDMEAFAGVLLATSATLFATESVWKVLLRDASLWALLLFAGAMATSARAAPVLPLRREVTGVTG